VQDLNFLKSNLSLSELYAGNNHISSITGCLERLKNLKILHLQNNQISNLDDIKYEFRHLTALENLNLFDNPITSANGYKQIVIDTLPRLRVLDRKSNK
ncbi:unnamed protein product, partial [Didymodactylos carnosus]